MLKSNDLDTPVLLINQEIMRANLLKMAKLCREREIKLRPHVKTHKIGKIALEQVKLSGNGIAVSKLSEAEVMTRFGIDDILIANELIGDKKIERLNRILENSDIGVCVDSREGVDQLEKNIITGTKILKVYIEVDTGMNRCGLSDQDEILKLANYIQKKRKLRFTGILSHSGNIYQSRSRDEVFQTAKEEIAKMVAAGDFLRKRGIAVDEISVGSTPASLYLDKALGITEFRPGNYVLNDMMQVSLGVARVADCALSIVATVISRPVTDRAVIDAGSKSLGLDKGVHGSEIIKGHGFIREYPNAVIERLSEEHGILKISKEMPISIGDRLTIVPNHACSVMNLFEEAVIIEKERVVDIRKIDARGMSR